jgi:hypothetical protein
MDIEDYLSDLMEQGAADALAEVDMEALLRGGEHLGMRMRRRRRNRTVLSAAAAIVALAAGTAAAITTTSPSYNSAAPTHPAHTAAPPQKPSPSPTPTVTHQRPVTYQDIQATFTRLVPTGFTVSLDPKTPQSLQSAKFTNLRIDDGHGAAVVFVGVTGDASTDFGSGACPAKWTEVDEGPRPPGALPAGCSSEKLPNGDRLVNVVTGDDGYGYYDIEVSLLRGDGVLVTLTVGNGVLGTSVPVTVTRARPPLSITQADELVSSPLWQASVTVPGPA